MSHHSTPRPATPADMDGIRRCHAEIEALMGETLDLPAVDDAAILEFYVVEKDGAIIGGMYLEKSVRQCHFGLSPEATAALLPIQDQVLASSKEAGVRFIHCQIPRNLPLFEQVSRHLEKAGYGRRDDLVDHMIDLRP